MLASKAEETKALMIYHKSNIDYNHYIDSQSGQ